MILFTTPTCNPCKAVKAFIEEKRLPVEIVDISTMAGTLLAQDRNLNIRGVPALYSDGELLLGDKAIMEKLNECTEV